METLTYITNLKGVGKKNKEKLNSPVFVNESQCDNLVRRNQHYGMIFKTRYLK